MNRKLRLADLTPDTTVDQIVKTGSCSGDLLASIGLNPEKHNDRTLRSVCQERQWNEVELLDWLRKKDQSLADDASPRYEVKNNVKAMSSNLSEFHKRNRKLLAEIENAFPRIHQVHGNQYPWLKTMKWHFNSFQDAVGLLYRFEEEKFLPLVKNMSERKSSILHGTVQRIDRCIDIINHDHDRLSRQMKTIRAKARNFKNPANACTTLRIMNQNFELLFNSLNEQFEFEQQSLIPKVKEQLSLVEG